MEERLNIIDDMAELVRSLLVGENINRIEDIKEIVKHSNGFIEESDNVNRSCLIKKNESFIIRLSSKLNEKQRRLWIAFELGNLFIHMGYQGNPDKFNSYENDKIYKSESEYNDQLSLLFAIAFLLPKKSFISKMKENYDGDGIYNIKEVAEYFNIDENIVAVRGKNLGLLAKGKIINEQ